MDPFNTPQFTFPQLDIAKQKDNILKYLSYNSTPQTSEKVYDDLKLEDIPKEDFNEYLKEMGQDGVLDVKEMSEDRKILIFTDKGKRFLRAGGYMEECKDDLNEKFQELLEREKNETKRDLEIENLRANIKHNKSTRTMTIIALIISGLTFLYLIIKDLLLKIIN